MHTVSLADEQLLRDALELADGVRVELLVREPLGEGSVAGFRVLDRETDLTYFVDTSRRRVARETGLAAGDPASPEVRVWLHPSDPHLPALAPVAFAHAAEALLARLGIRATGSPETVAYRPGRRAVLRVPVESGSSWVKVVPPSRVERIVRTHAELARAGVPVPELFGWSQEGLLVLATAEGTPVKDAPWEPQALLDEVDRLRDAFEGVALAGEARTDLDRRLRWYASRLEAEDAERGPRVQALRGRLDAAWGTPDPRTVHGDLHFGQLFVDGGGRLSGVIDVDTAGVGATSDDTGAFLAHAIASAMLTPPDRRERVWMLARAAFRRWDADPVAGDGLRARTATHLLGHLLGAVQHGDEARADALLAAAERIVDGRVDSLGI